MTREEAIKNLNTIIMATHIKDTSLGSLEDVRETCLMAIKALEQEPIIDKIRAEIDQLSDSRCDGTTVTIYSWNGMKSRVLDIIDKYKTGSEEE